LTLVNIIITVVLSTINSSNSYYVKNQSQMDTPQQNLDSSTMSAFQVATSAMMEWHFVYKYSKIIILLVQLEAYPGLG
jgi:hypothetical protein